MVTTDTRHGAIKLARYANDLRLGGERIISGPSSSEIETVIMSYRSKDAYSNRTLEIDLSGGESKLVLFQQKRVDTHNNAPAVRDFACNSAVARTCKKTVKVHEGYHLIEARDGRPF